MMCNHPNDPLLLDSSDVVRRRSKDTKGASIVFTHKHTAGYESYRRRWFTRVSLKNSCDDARQRVPAERYSEIIITIFRSGLLSNSSRWRLLLLSLCLYLALSIGPSASRGLISIRSDHGVQKRKTKRS